MTIITTPLITHSGVRDVFITENDKFAVVITYAGIEFVNLYQGQVVSSGTIPGGYEPLCAGADWTISSGSLYVGTSGGGVFSTRYHPARNPGTDFSSSFVQKFSTATTPALSSNVVRDLDVKPGRLLIGTSSGIDFIVSETAIATKPLVSGAFMSHLTDNGLTGYWLTCSSVQVKYSLPVGGTISPDFEYSVISNPALPAPNPTDIAIAEAPVRALAFATPSGAFVLEEKPFAESTAQTKLITAPNPLTEVPAPVFVSVDFSYNSDYDTGILFGLTNKRLYSIGLYNNTTSGIHPQDLMETVVEFSSGQAISSGVNNIVRTTTVPV